MGSGSVIKKAIEKYGKENFVKEIIADYPTRKEASDHERSIVTFEVIIDKNCYNMRTGGDNNNPGRHTDETKQKIGLVRLGKPMSTECIENRKQYWKDHPEEAIAKAQKSAESRRRNGTNKHSAETKEKLKKCVKKNKCCILGIEYDSILDASKSIGLTFGCTRARINSESEIFKDWIKIEE